MTSEKFLTKEPTLICIVARGYKLYEDPDNGDESPLWAISPSGDLKQTDFYEVDSAMDDEYFAELFSPS